MRNYKYPLAIVIVVLAASAFILPEWGQSSNGANPAAPVGAASQNNSDALASSLTPPDSAGMTATPSPTSAPTPMPTATPVPNNYIWVPWRTQLDGTTYAEGNCGPASLGMAMAYFGEWWSTDGIRKSVNTSSGVWVEDGGADWLSLKRAAEERGFTVNGPVDASGAYREWTIEELVGEIEQERPVLLLVRFKTLPDHAQSDWFGDHYIVFLGLMADGRVVYHDPAFASELDGSYRIMSQETLMKAWSDTMVGQVCTAMSLDWPGESRKWDEPAPETPPTN